jgi:hypothetical protein
MLLGITVPTHWPTVEAVLVALCDLAGVDPDEEVGGYYQNESSSRREDLERAWHRALDHPDERNVPIRSVASVRESDPWATEGSSDYSDEPPF